MSLRSKTLAFLALSIAAFVGASLWILEGVVMTRLARVEHEQTAADVAQARALVQHCTKEFGERAASWSDWDQMAQFLRDGNQAFLDENVSASALTDQLRVDVLVIARDSGVPVYATQLDSAGTGLEACSSDFLLQLTPQSLMRPGEAYTGLLAFRDHTYMVSSRPIRTTNGSIGEVQGRLVTGREIDADWLQGLRDLSGMDLSLSRSSESPMEEEELAARETLRTGAGCFVAESSGERISGYCQIPDLHGQPAIVLHVVRARDVSAGGREILRAILLTLGSAGVLYTLLAYAAAWSAVLQPVERLLAGTRRLWRGERSHVILKSGDELEALSRDINRMTDAVFETEEALQNAHRDPADTSAPALPSHPTQVIPR